MSTLVEGGDNPLPSKYEGGGFQRPPPPVRKRVRPRTNKSRVSK